MSKVNVDCDALGVMEGDMSKLLLEEWMHGG